MRNCFYSHTVLRSLQVAWNIYFTMPTVQTRDKALVCPGQDLKITPNEMKVCTRFSKQLHVLYICTFAQYASKLMFIALLYSAGRIPECDGRSCATDDLNSWLFSVCWGSFLMMQQLTGNVRKMLNVVCFRLTTPRVQSPVNWGSLIYTSQ